jgi:sec-independent protein translocase protein TatB
MFDIGFLEIVIIAAIALIVLGPERLPRAARTAGMWVGRARSMVSAVKTDIDREIRESELADMRKLGEEVTSIKSDLTKTAESIAKDDSMGDVVDSIKESANAMNQDIADKAGTN